MSGLGPRRGRLPWIASPVGPGVIGWLAQVGHLARKDLRRLRGVFGAFLLLLTAVVARGWAGPMEVADYDPPLRFLALAVGLVGVLILVREDGPHRIHERWAALPLRASAVLAAKLVVAAGAVAILPLAGHALLLARYGIAATELSAHLLPSLTIMMAAMSVTLLLGATFRSPLGAPFAGTMAVLVGGLLLAGVLAAEPLAGGGESARGTGAGVVAAASLAVLGGMAAALALLIALYHRDQIGPGFKAAAFLVPIPVVVGTGVGALLPHPDPAPPDIPQGAGNPTPRIVELRLQPRPGAWAETLAIIEWDEPGWNGGTSRKLHSLNPTELILEGPQGPRDTLDFVVGAWRWSPATLGDRDALPSGTSRLELRLALDSHQLERFRAGGGRLVLTGGWDAIHLRELGRLPSGSGGEVRGTRHRIQLTPRVGAQAEYTLRFAAERVLPPRSTRSFRAIPSPRDTQVLVLLASNDETDGPVLEEGVRTHSGVVAFGRLLLPGVHLHRTEGILGSIDGPGRIQVDPSRSERMSLRVFEAARARSTQATVILTPPPLHEPTPGVRR